MTLLDADRTTAEPTTWVAVCALGHLLVGRGVAALVDGQAVAIFRLDAAGTVRVIDNVDPCSGASVLSRGLVGETLDESRDDGRSVRYVASPLRKERFDLDTGRCLDATTGVATWPARVVDGVVEVGAEASRWSNGPETTP